MKTLESYLSDFLSATADKYYLDANSFTYVSDCHNTVSWIDHVYTNVILLPQLKDFAVLYDVNNLSVIIDHLALPLMLSQL